MSDDHARDIVAALAGYAASTVFEAMGKRGAVSPTIRP